MKMVQDSFLSEAALIGYDLLRDECGLIQLDTASVLLITGEDRKGWLQGQATNDLRGLQTGGMIQFCLVKPTGQLEAICSMWALDDRYYLLTPSKCVQAVLSRFEKMVIMEDVKVEMPPCKVLSVQGPEATDRLGSLISLPLLDVSEMELEGEKIVCLRSNRTGFGGWDLLIQGDSGKAISKLTSEFESVSHGAYRVASFEAGRPVFGVDTDAKTLPPELGSAFESTHISYTKGCYVGQEVLMRLHSRGHTNRRWMALLADATLEPGDVVLHNRKDAGLVTSSYYSPEFGFIAGAYLRTELAQSGEIVTVQNRSGLVEAELQEMPLLRLG